MTTAAALPRPSAGPGEAELGATEFAQIAAVMQREARIHLTEAKRTLVHSRLSRRLRENGITSFRDYVALVERDPVERRTMVIALTTNHTHFFRESHHFDHFRSVLMPQLKGRSKGQSVRIWSAGCSSGEEVYTIAMCLLGRDRTDAAWLRGADVRLLATDISTPVVQAAERGVYAAAARDSIPEPYRSTWLRPHVDGFEMAAEAKALVTARTLNLFESWPMRQLYDAIFCRNVMIYFDDEAKADLEARLVERLAPGGFLYIGHSERLIAPAKLGMSLAGQTIYQKNGGPR
ncbi:CheR family methyltransferase [Novosphingobium sp. M1R2S20]|uniref:Chemotaxis protein methyltransferase n=1 Tax=Novosphingobium rhizovicinum TaxID=3228928 RepID=A0ABV3R8W9_9SPHN